MSEQAREVIPENTDVPNRESAEEAAARFAKTWHANSPDSRIPTPQQLANDKSTQEMHMRDYASV